MALLIHAYEDGQVRPWEYLPADDATYVVGQALVMDATNGYLVPVSSGVGEDTDEGKHYVCMANKTIATAGDILPVVATDDQMVWAIPLNAANSSIKVGAAYTLHTDGLHLTNTTTKGCFTVLDYDGTAAGDIVRGKLV